ncbi:MAG: hypothetical protein WDO73_10155 [Ignavibacteriota bacterium]
MKVAEVADAATVAEAGTVREELVFDRLTVAPPVGAAWDSVTVQMLEAFGPRVVGVHDSEETVAETTSAMVLLAELPLYVAVTVALAFAAKAPVAMLKVVAVAGRRDGHRRGES